MKKQILILLIKISLVGLLTYQIMGDEIKTFVRQISLESQLSRQEVIQTQAANQKARRAEQKARATEEACETRQERKWCASRQKWANDQESNISALLKMSGGRDGLTSREQTKVDDMERALALYRRTCEASETSLGALVEEVDLLLQSPSTLSRKLNRERIGYMSSC